ncbi:hypothetical protein CAUPRSCDRAFT_12847 [Caulochytrium protostelioides]|uniref:Uncharacterized protein n=1 Tax=Caulochytrium protostelioides TaxID=1555241 RepID=A0A4P9WQY1_9FUNG|nr:hypothetical protein CAUPRSCDRAFT_12847 [Caulochytrium protostelioides]
MYKQSEMILDVDSTGELAGRMKPETIRQITETQNAFDEVLATMVSSDTFDPSQVDLDAILPEVDDVARVPILSNPLFVRQLINAILGQLTIAQLQLGIPERFHPWVRKMREPATDAQSKEYQSLVDKFVQDVDIAATHVLQHRDPFAPIVDPSVIIPTAPRDIGGRLMFYDKHDYNLPETILSRDDLDNDSYPSRPLELCTRPAQLAPPCDLDVGHLPATCGSRVGRRLVQLCLVAASLADVGRAGCA